MARFGLAKLKLVYFESNRPCGRGREIRQLGKYQRHAPIGAGSSAKVNWTNSNGH